MPEARACLIETLRTVIDGRKLTPAELDAAIPDPRGLEPFEKRAWEALSHWADDDDIRARDPSYEAFQQKELLQALADLEALEVGYTAEEVELGDHQGHHVPPWGCLLFILLIGLVIYGALRWAGD